MGGGREHTKESRMEHRVGAAKSVDLREMMSRERKSKEPTSGH
jgi:hypothetical protein